MDLKTADEAIKRVLSDKRYAHSIRVAETAEKLCQIHGGDMEKIKLAAVLHDYAKCFTIDQLKSNLKQYNLPESLFDFHHELWHGPVAAAIAENEFGIKDEEITNAVRYHTTGRPQMSKVEYIIFVADYIEPGRHFPGVNDVRELAQHDLVLATRMALKNTILYLMRKDSTIHPDSFNAYNWLTDKVKER